MADHRNPAGLPARQKRLRRNRWSRAIERRPTAATAASGFAAYMFGVLLLMVSVFVMIAGLTMVTGDLGNGSVGRAAGVGLLIVGAALFAAGRWFLVEYAVERRH